MSGFPLWTRALALPVLGALPATGLSAIPQGDDHIDVIADYVDEALLHVGQDHLTGALFYEGDAFISADETVLVQDGTVSMDFGLGTELELSLPGGPAATVELTDDGDIVFEDIDEGLHAAVQSLDGGAARLLTVADENYSDSPVHEYVYEINLSEHAWIEQLEDGTIAILEENQPSLSPADQAILDDILPGEEYEESPDELESHETNPEALEADGPEFSEGTTLVTYFQTPWAVDAEGHELPTSLSLVDGNLIQTVDTTGASFPVVSDPLPLVAIALGTAARALAPHVARAFATQTIRQGAAATTRGGYTSFARFKTAAGNPGRGYQWHHVVEQSTIKNRGFNARWIHNRNNLVAIPKAVHQKCVNSWMAKKGVKRFGASAPSSQTMRQWVHKQSYARQHQIGINLLRHCGVQV